MAGFLRVAADRITQKWEGPGSVFGASRAALDAVIEEPDLER